MSFEKKRLAFADELRQLRERKGYTGRDFAELLGWTNSKISKIERGKQTPADDDLTTWLGAVDASATLVKDLRDRLRGLRIEQISWRRQLREGHRARQEEDQRTEADAHLIRAVDVAAVPGLLQTPDYARWIFRSQAELLGVSADDVDASVRARLARQRVLYDGERTIEILLTESALTHHVCPREVQAAQLDRLIAAVDLPGVRIGIVPAGQVPYTPWHGFWIVDDRVFIEYISDEVRIADPEQIAIYHRIADALWNVAVERETARSLLKNIAADVR